MLKNFFWFAHRPADERETKLLYQAYIRAFFVLWLGLVAAIFASHISDVHDYLTISSYVPPIALLMLASVLAGAWVVKDEDFDTGTKKIAHQPSFLVFSLGFLAIFLAALALTYFAPHLAYISIFGFLLFTYILKTAFAWSWTKNYTAHARLLGSLVLALPTLGFLLTQKRSIPLRALSALAMFVIFTVGPYLIASLTVFRYVAMPITVTSSVFGYGGYMSESSQERVIINLKDTSPQVGDFILYEKPWDGVPSVEMVAGVAIHKSKTGLTTISVIGKVISIDNQNITLEIQDAYEYTNDLLEPEVTKIIPHHHTEVIQPEAVVGTALTYAPGWKLMRKIGL